jgi:hypothetical protein
MAAIQLYVEVITRIGRFFTELLREFKQVDLDINPMFDFPRDL